MERTNKTLQIDFNEGHGFNFTPNKSTLLTNKHKYSLNICRLFYLNNMVNLA